LRKPQPTLQGPLQQQQTIFYSLFGKAFACTVYLLHESKFFPL
jgi:hypothetical protein